MAERELSAMLEKMVERKASDLFLSVGAKALVKVEGRFEALDEDVLDPSALHALCYSVLTEQQRKTLEATRELNMSLGIPRLGRFRLNLFRQRGELAMVVRHINGVIPDLSSLNLPPLLGDIIMEDRGLILLVGGTGTGKSSTMAAMIAHRSQHRGGHILTIEDPIEFLHSHHGNSLINQREIGLDTDSFDVALRNAMREAPNVIMIGEIRDVETMKHALAYAETGHLCLSTLHANNANQAIERILHFFPDSAHAQILQDLSLNLRAVISQRLIIGLDHKRVPAIEIMLNTPYVSELIEGGKVDQLKEAMSQATALGCKTLDDALYDLVLQQKISTEEALRHADSRTNLALRFKLEGTEKKKEEPKTAGAPASNEKPKKDISFARKIDFRVYKTFRVSCALFKCMNSELKFQMETALRTIMASKGLKYQFEHPDVEVKFAFSAPQPAHQELALLLEDEEPQAPPVLVNDQAAAPETLVIDMYDMHLAEPVWRMRTTVSLANARKTQEQITYEFRDYLGNFPPGQT